MRVLHRVYTPALRRSRCSYPQRRVALRLAPDRRSASRSSRSLGGEFMPKLEEGNFWIRATLADVHLARAEREVRRPDARRSSAAARRTPDVPCDDAEPQAPGGRRRSSRSSVAPTTAPTCRASTTSSSSRRSSRSTSGRAGSPRTSSPTSSTRSSTEAFPGVVFNFSQYISDNVEEALSGVKGENSIKVFGPDLEANEKIADEIVDVDGRASRASKDLGHVPVARPAEHQDRARPRRRARATASTPATSTRSIQAAIGGQAVTQVYEGEKFFDLTVRWLSPSTASSSRPSARSRSRRRTARRSRSGRSPTSRRWRARDHLPRGRRALLAGEVQRPRPRSREHDRRGRQSDRSARQGRTSSPYDTHLEWAGRDQRAEGGRGAPAASSSRSRSCSSRSSSTAR